MTPSGASPHRGALWLARAGALLSLPAIAVACAASYTTPEEALCYGVAFSVPYLLLLPLIGFPSRRSLTSWGLVLAAVTPVVGIVAFAFVAPAGLREDSVPGSLVAALWLFPVAQAALAGGSLVARRSFPQPAARLPVRLAIGLGGIAYLAAVAAALSPGHRHVRWSINTTRAASDVRTMMSAQAVLNSSWPTGWYGAVECLEGSLAEPPDLERERAPNEAPRLWACGLPGPPEVLLDERMRRSIRAGYRFELHGLPVAGHPGALSTFAYTAVPLDTRGFPGWRRTGGRAFCGDSTGRLCFTADGSAPPIEDGLCGSRCTPYQ
jgi:hypothetical protein